MKLVKVVSSVVVALGLASFGAQTVSAATEIAPLAPAEEMVANPEIKKGEKIIVVVKDTKKQTVTVYNKNAKKTHKTVKMGKRFTAKAVKRFHGKKIVKVSGNRWLNTKDVTKY
ncbi:MAG: hypothetical protein H9806_04275 [Candidatus Lactobacillus pullistercoris]|uniref:Surface layer protein A domain-containing protein n=1 Tax=Candidatus Lactobacillus pullistercoris TaxID=2838636 RepID=A0A9E2KQV4_9LACO|nr:hypothetical protein [Candidatus Lactobacillus pullistercoris]